MLSAARATAQPQASPLALFPVLPVWTTSLDANLSAPAVFGAGHAIVALEGGGLAAYDLRTGTRAWTRDVTVSGPLAISERHLYFGTSGALVAVDVKTGADVWRTPLEGFDGGPFVFRDDVLLGVVASKTVAAFNAQDGKLAWRRNLLAAAHAAPALAANRAYVPLDDGQVMALDATTGEQVWTRKLGGAPNDILALDDRLYVGSDDNFFYCLFAKDGSTNWRWRTGGDVIGVPLSDGDRVYFVSKDNVLRGLDRHSGAQRWKRALAGRPTRGVVRVADVVLASGIAPRIWGFAMKDGAPAGEVTTVGELASQPYVEAVNALPWLFLATHDISAGTRLQAFRRNLEPTLNTPLTAVPGAITLPSAGPTGAQPALPASPPEAASPPGPPPSPAASPVTPSR